MPITRMAATAMATTSNGAITTSTNITAMAIGIGIRITIATRIMVATTKRTAIVRD